MRNRQKFSVMLSAMLVLLVGLSIAYAALSTTLNVTVSNVTETGLTWNIGISFLIPIVLGISLSYITSKFMAMKENLYLHRGMSEESFYKLITKVTSNEEHINICKMYYVDKESNVKIALRFNYSEINIKKIKQNINNKIKELYK